MTAPLPAARSLRQAYESFLEQRVEEYKETLTREQLLRIGDEAVHELEQQVGATTQYLFTEVLVAEYVNRLIAQRLKLPSYRRWVTTYLALRRAQLDPMHWGLSPQGQLSSMARALGEDDHVLVVGACLCGAGLYIAAHEVPVMLVDPDLAAVEVAENRAVTEQLSLYFEAFVAALGDWLPPCAPRLVLLDASLLGTLEPATQTALVRELKARTKHGGAHVLLAGPGGTLDGDTLQARAAEAYDEWECVLPHLTDTDLAEVLIARIPGLSVE